MPKRLLKPYPQQKRYIISASRNPKKGFQRKEQQAKLDFEQDLEDSGDLSNNSTVDNEPTVPDTDSSSSMEDRSDSSSSNDRVDDSDPIVETADALESKLKDLVNNEHVVENVYVEVPKVKLDKYNC